MVGLPRVEHCVKRRLVVEIAIAPVDRQPRRGDRHQDRAGAARMTSWRSPGAITIISWPKPRRGAQLGLDIGAHAAAGGRVKSANVGDPHRPVETVRAGEVQVKLC